jgi:CheY-like chemotaxis protein
MQQYQATSKIRTDFETDDVRNVPIIAMTASAIQGDKEKCQKAGMDVSGQPHLESGVAEGYRITWRSLSKASCSKRCL